MTADTDFSPVVIGADAARARQCVWSGRGPVLLENRDPATTVYLGGDEGMGPGDNDTAPLDPLGTKGFDGTRDIWCKSLSGTATIVSLPSGTLSTTSPAISALQIATSGVGLLNFSNKIALNAPASVGTGGTTLPATGSFPVGQTGYHGLLQVTTPNAGVTTLLVVMSWYVSGIYVGTDSFFVYAPAVGSTHQVKLRGPTKGNSLVVQLFASTGTVNLVSFNLYQDSRDYKTDQWVSDHFSGTFPGVAAISACDPDAYLLHSFSAVINAGITDTFLLPMWTGKAVLSANTGSNTNDLVVGVFSTADALANVGNIALLTSDAIGGINLVQLWLPRTQCFLALRNKNAANQTVNCNLIAAEY